MYNWLIVMKNGDRLFVKHQYNKVGDLINDLLPKEINSKKFTVVELVYPDINGNNFVIINGEEISHILYKSK